MPSIRGSGRRSRRLQNDINVVPYIDVMLVLLVIFMVTAPMITPGLVNLPSVGQAADVPVAPLEVQLNQDGLVSVRMRNAGAEFEPIDPQNLVSEVGARISADTPVVIAADGRVPYENVMKIMDQLRSSGITRLGLLVDQVGDTASATPPATPAATTPKKK